MSPKKIIRKKIRSIQKRENPNLTRDYMEFPREENGVLYVRQSTLIQVQNNIHSFEMQTDKFLEHFRNRGCTGHIEIVADDEGMSGTLDIHELPGLSRVMKMIEGKELINGKKIGWAAAVDVKRLTRDKWLVKPGTLMRACYENNVWISTLRMDFNFQDEYCQRVFMLEAEEAARHLEWMKLVMGGGKAIASSNGYYDGRWLAPGYIVDRSDEKKKKYTVYEPHAEVVRWLFRRYFELDGNFWELCREVEKMPFLFPKFEEWVDPKNVHKFTGHRQKRGSLILEGTYAGNYQFSSDGIRGVLCNPVYIGWWLPFTGGVIENNHDAIVEEYLFTYAHKRLSSYDLNGERQKPVHVTRNGKAEAILKKRLFDDRGNPMYAQNGGHHGKQFCAYDSNEKSGLSVTFRYSLDVKRLDAIFLEKFFERIEALKKLEDWQDKLAERQAARQASQEYQIKLIHKQIADAQARWKETFDTLNDPAIPKTKMMKIESARQMAGLEEKIVGWENELQSMEENEDEDDEITLYQIHSLLPNIAAKWDKLSFGVRLRFVGAVVRKVVLSQVAPSWLRIDIHWKEAIGNFVDTGHFMRVTNSTKWSQEEESILRDIYPHADAVEILQALPDRSWDSIQHKTGRMGIKRDRRKHNSIHVSVEDFGTIEDRKYMEAHQLTPIRKTTQWSRLRRVGLAGGGSATQSRAGSVPPRLPRPW